MFLAYYPFIAANEKCLLSNTYQSPWNGKFHSFRFTHLFQLLSGFYFENEILRPITLLIFVQFWGKK